MLEVVMLLMTCLIKYVFQIKQKTMDDLAITCVEVRDSYDKETKTFPTNFNEKKTICKAQNFYILLEFLLITIVLLIDVSIYCYLIKY